MLYYQSNAPKKFLFVPSFNILKLDPSKFQRRKGYQRYKWSEALTFMKLVVRKVYERQKSTAETNILAHLRNLGTWIATVKRFFLTFFKHHIIKWQNLKTGTSM